MIHPNTLNEIAAAYEERLAAMREQLAEAKDETDTWKTIARQINTHWIPANEGLAKQLAEAKKDAALWKALCKQLWVACPTTLECRAFHHAKQDQHRMTETCRPQEGYLAAIDAVNQAMREGE